MLFFPQVCLLAAVGGVLAVRYPGPGLMLLGLVWLLDMPRSKTPARTLLLALSFAGAAVYAGVSVPSPPPVPGWLEDVSTVKQAPDGKRLSPRAVRIRARVLDSTPLSDNRLRLILEQALPAEPLPLPAEHSNSVPEQAALFSAPYQGRIVWTWRQPDIAPLPGQTLEATIRLSPVRGMNNPGLWEMDQYWRDHKVWFRAWSGSRTKAVILAPGEAGLPPEESWSVTFARMRRDLRLAFLAALPKDALQAKPTQGISLSEGAAMLPALIFGDRSFFTSEQNDLVARSTLTHSLALSGLHLGYTVLIGVLLACGIGRCFPRLWLYISRPLAALLLALPLAGGYLWLGQAPLPLMRAACMLLFWTLLLILKRPKALLDGLFAAVASLLLLDPSSLFDLGLELSVLSVAVLALVLPLISAFTQRLLPEQPEKKRGAPSSGFSVPAQNALSPGKSAYPTSDWTFRGLAAPRNWPYRLWFRSFLRWGFSLLGLSFCIQVALLPLVLRTFGSTGLWFPLNLVWLPVLGALVMPPAFLGLLFSGLGLELPALIALHVAALPCDGLMLLLHTLDEAGLLLAPLMPRPHWLSSAGFWLLCLTLPMAFHKSPRETRLGTALFALAGLVMLLLPPALAFQASLQPGVRLRLLDVGQGQAVLLEWSGLSEAGAASLPSSGRALIDGGGFVGDGFDVGKSILAPILTDNALPRLDVIVNSHPDTDHLAGLVYILEHFSVGRYLGNGDRPTPALEKREQAALRQNGLTRGVLKAGDKLTLGPGLCLDVLWPDESSRREPRPPGEEKGNNASLVLRLVWRETGLALLCGDAEAPALQALIAKEQRPSHDPPSGTTGQTSLPPRRSGPVAAQVLVLPHHGSSSSLTPALYEAVQAKLALASCGYANKWGFPSVEVKKALQALGIPLLDTAENGQIQVLWRTPGSTPEVELANTKKTAE